MITLKELYPINKKQGFIGIYWPINSEVDLRELINHKEYTPAMLQEFLFFNRKNDTFMDSIKDFYKIIEKNNLESLTNESGSNVYM